ncbi:helix-turn-helix domain-containing protein [Streptomyces sp. NBC_00096]|uniref:helix-turn-helix domain-containing protein n=1 Tax=Streptomyces sp. NBC_00096 TaxID=2975650 RepID=UPI00324F84C8
MTDDKKNPLGPTGDRVRANVERLRVARGLTKKDVSDRARELGRSIPPLGISRLEAGTRRVDADDLVTLALVLNVSVNTLLLPPSAGDGEIELASGRAVTARTAWRWSQGGGPAIDPAPESDGYPIGPGGDPVAAAEADEREQDYHRQRAEYLALALPPELRRAADQSAVRVARQLAELVEDLVAQASAEDAAPLLRMARRRHQALGLELEELEEQLKA